MDIGNIILIVALLGLLVMYPIMMFRKNKKEQERQNTLIDSLKVGQYVITYSGVFGKIVEIKEKEFGKFVTIETGEAHKNYVTISINAVYMLTNNNPKVYDASGEEVKATEIEQAEMIKEPKKETKKEPKKPAKK
ncbi:MAG: preprotein translocase subunit YajC [Clostridia bacterium]|nr:preprotein translocase subunit YajC [Clostridia bacterium]